MAQEVSRIPSSAKIGPRAVAVARRLVIVALRVVSGARGRMYRLVLLQLAVVRGLLLELVRRALLAQPALHHQLVEERHEEDREERGAEHPAHDARADRLAGARARP